MIRKSLSLLIVLTIFLLAVNAQDQKESKAVRYHNKALQYYHASAYDEALEETRKAIRADDMFIKAWLLAGDIQALKGNKTAAIEDYKKAISIDSNFFKPAYYILANLLFDQNEYQESITNFQRYLTFPDVKEAEILRAKKRIETAKFRIKAIENPVPFKPVNLGPNVNTSGYEFVNYITPDRRKLYFTRRMTSGSRRDEQFFYCENINDSAWSPAVDIGPPINSELDEGAMTVSPDGQNLFFSGCNNIDGLGSCDLYVSQLEGDNWGIPVNLGPVVNTPGWESQPSFSSDGRTLYFVSNRPGGKGSSDIWITKRDLNGEWSEPYNAGDSINTKEAERGPFIHPDAKTLYFSSKGHIGMGQGDIFYSKLTNGVWSKPVNLGYPINSEEDEVTMIVDNDGRYAYYSSAKEKGFGLQDIYQFELPAIVRPKRVSYMKGIIYDSITKKPLKADIRLLQLVTGDTVIFSSSNSSDGSYLLVIPAGENYALNVQREGYLFYSAHFEMKEETNYINPFRKDIPLKPLGIGESIVLRNIFFDTDSFNLLPESTVELDYLIQLLKKNKGMRIEIRGHTDNVGTEEYNLVLSEKRARSVYNFLIKSGIDSQRLRYKGFGATVPVATNTTPNGRSLNRRTEMVVIQVN
jgi:outer membrane protein OmpA-like peptidoglycan-associated protein